MRVEVDFGACTTASHQGKFVSTELFGVAQGSAGKIKSNQINLIRRCTIPLAASVLANRMFSHLHLTSDSESCNPNQ